MDMIIRKAESNDLSDLLEIYNYEVSNGTATFEIEPRTMQQWTEWFNDHNVLNHPLIVAEVDGRAVAYGSLSKYRERAAYDGTVELSVYVHKDYRRRHIAEQLMEELIRMAKEDERTILVVSVITGENDISCILHEKMGFVPCGVMHKAGVKFGKFLDIKMYEMIVK